MGWALTLNRHRLYDTWKASDTEAQVPVSDNGPSLDIRNLVASADDASSDIFSARQIVVLVGRIAGSIVSFYDAIDISEICNRVGVLCNTVLAFSLWTAVKAYSIVIGYLFPEVNELDALDKPMVFMVADTLEGDDQAHFMGLYTHEMRMTYLMETSHPERLHRILNWYHGGVDKLPKAWKDVIYSIGCSVKKLHLDDGITINWELHQLVSWFPNLRELTISGHLLRGPSLQHIRKLTCLKHLKIERFFMGQATPAEVYASLSKLKQLEVLEMPLPDLSLDNLQVFTKAVANLRILMVTQCNAQISTEHVTALKSLKRLTQLSLEGNITWENRAALKALEGLEKLTHLTLGPAHLRQEITAADMPLFQKMPGLVHIALYNLPIDDKALKLLPKYNSELRFVELKMCNSVTDYGASALAELPVLEQLILVNCAGIRDGTMQHIAQCKALKSLALRTVDHPLSDAAIQKLGSCENLESCSLVGTLISSNGLASISRGCTKLRTLILESSVLLENRDMVHLRGLRELATLSINFCGNLDDLAVQEISQIYSLKSFTAVGTKITSASWHFWRNHSLIRELSVVNGATPILNEHVAHLPPELRALDVGNTRGLDLAVLQQQCPSITALNIGTIPRSGAHTTTQAIFATLRRFEQLEKLNLYNFSAQLFEPVTIINQIMGIKEKPKLKSTTINKLLSDIYKEIRLPIPVGTIVM